MAWKYVQYDEGKYRTTDQGGGGGSTVSITPTLQSGTKIADFEIDDVPGVLYAPSGGGGSGHTYSTTEQVVGTWIDGKPVYEKVVVKTNHQLVSGSNDISLGVQNMETLIDSTIHVSNSAHTNVRRVSQYEKTGNDQLGYMISLSSGTLTIYAYATWSTPNIYIIVRYTKTTD